MYSPEPLTVNIPLSSSKVAALELSLPMATFVNPSGNMDKLIALTHSILGII